MGDQFGRGRGGCVGQPNGLRPGDVSCVTRVLDAHRMSIAERRTAELIARIQPNEPSEERRKAVANFVERLITQAFPCKVCTFGSVPLKTYLPDGDIDLSVLSNNLHLKDTWANELRQVLENEEKNESAEFHVKEVQYIQAEVKIIKCLVDNLVVDVSFNQLGGLCTLDFLKEIDRLIDQDHLFKRSIILIKAWCYYESRILGAHHGLISTYALEILVLYVFHVFNNSFSGPLEVLYRFLEFFSNFDWENFCVSLWGPVPISSLPDTTAEPPLKDSGELLLSKSFFSVCNDISHAYPNSQEGQSQPFVSKHFNVIDPLRTNNNLGRSVSKGNFYRIRSALAFGAKRLARVLECSKTIILKEIDNFFINTWIRHSTGHRPDLPNPAVRQLQPLNVDTTDLFKVMKSANWETINEDLHADHVYPNDRSMASGAILSQPVKTIKQSTENVPRTSSPDYSHALDSYGYQHRVSDQTERRIDRNEIIPANKFPKKSNSDIFLRTHSSPELTGPSTEIFSHGNQSIKAENNEQKNLGSEFPGQSSVLADSSLQHGMGGRDNEFHVSETNTVLDGSPYDEKSASFGNEFASSDTMQAQHRMHQNEQDLINMMTSSSFHSVNGWVQHPSNISTHPSVIYPAAVFVQNGYPRERVGGMLPSSLIHPPGSIAHFPQALPSSHYIPNARLDSNQEAISESVNDSSSVTEVEQEDSDRGSCSDQNAGSESGFLPEKKGTQVQKTISDDKQPPFLGGFKSTSHFSDSNGPMRGQNKFTKAHRKSTEHGYSDAPVHPNRKEKDLHSTDKSAFSRFPAISSRTESVSDFSSKKSFKKEMDRRRRKQASSSYNKGKDGWQYEDSSSDHVSVIDEDNRECAPPASRNSETAEENISSLATAHYQACQVSGPNPAVLNGSESIIPVPPMLLCTNPQQRDGGDTGGGPITFVPTGPVVPFVMVPFSLYKTPSDSNNTGESREHVIPSSESYEVGHEVRDASVELSSNQNEGRNPDILNSDVAGHWQNLQCGRFYHTPPSQGSLVGASPVMLPQAHIHGHHPIESSRRPSAPDLNAFSQIMSMGHSFVPLVPPQPGSSRPSGLNQNYRKEVPRRGIGTYLPDPKISFTDRQTSSTRHRRGNFHHDWNEHDDRGGNWSSSKSRYGGRGHSRNQFDRSYSRFNQSSSFDNKADRPSNSHRHGRMPSYQTDNSSFGSQRSNDGFSPNAAHGMRLLPALNPNCVPRTDPASSPPVTFYPPIAGDASTEQVGNDVPWSTNDDSKTVGMPSQRHEK